MISTKQFVPCAGAGSVSVPSNNVLVKFWIRDPPFPVANQFVPGPPTYPPGMFVLTSHEKSGTVMEAATAFPHVALTAITAASRQRHLVFNLIRPIFLCFVTTQFAAGEYIQSVGHHQSKGRSRDCCRKAASSEMTRIDFQLSGVFWNLDTAIQE